MAPVSGDRSCCWHLTQTAMSLAVRMLHTKADGATQNAQYSPLLLNGNSCGSWSRVLVLTVRPVQCNG